MLAPSFTASAALLLAAGLGDDARPAARQELDASTLARIDRIVDEALAASGAEGLVVLVDLAGRPLLERAYGETHRHPSFPARVDSQFRAGAMCEPFVATCLLQLAQEGAVDLDADLSSFYPVLAWDGQRVPLRSVLDHTSGLPALDAVMHTLHARRRGAAQVQQAGAAVAPAPDGLEQVLAVVGALALQAEPGTCFDYVHTDHVVATAVLQKVTGKPMAEVLNERLFEPLGMTDTAFRSDGPALHETAAAVTEVGGEGVRLAAHEELFDEALLCTTAPDLVRWMRALAHGDLLDGAHWRLMSEPARSIKGQDCGFGLGLGQTELEQYTAVCAGGAMAGSRAHVAFYPALDTTVVVVGETTELPAQRIERRVMRAILDVPEPGVHDWPLTPEQLGRYVGDYQIGCTRLVVRVLGDHLTLAWDEHADTLLLHQGRHLFVAGPDPELRLQFTVEDGLATSFELDDHGKMAVATRFGG